jgi:hypothetical protein
MSIIGEIRKRYEADGPWDHVQAIRDIEMLLVKVDLLEYDLYDKRLEADSKFPPLCEHDLHEVVHSVGLCEQDLEAQSEAYCDAARLLIDLATKRYEYEGREALDYWDARRPKKEYDDSVL